MRTLPALALGCVIALPACSSTPPLMESPRLEHGYVAICGGPLGDIHTYDELADGLREGGVRGGIEVVDWGEAPHRWPPDLRAAGVEAAWTEVAVGKIAAYREEYPGKPVWLVGHAGGAGYALLVLDSLPGESLVEGVLLLAPAIHPDCELTPYLRRTRKGIWCFYSERDRSHSGTAAQAGFNEPAGLPEADRDLYDSLLHQVPWSTEMALAGHEGGPWGWLEGRFARGYLAPMLREE